MASPSGLEVDESHINHFPIHSESQGLEVIPAEHHDTAASAPEALHTTLPQSEKEALTGYDGGEDKQYNDQAQLNEPSKGLARRRKYWLFLALALALIIVIVIAIAVPLATRHKDRKTSQPSKTSANSPTGLLADTKLASCSQGNATTNQTTLFYQDSSNQIRLLQKQGQDPNFHWTGGNQTQPLSLPSPAKNATPMSCVNYTDTKANVNVAHLFYLDHSNYLQEIVSRDEFATWQPGPLGNASISASSASIALAATYNDRWFGTVMGASAGLRLYYGGIHNDVEELAYALDVETSWTKQSSLTGANGNAGITILPTNPDSYTHLYVLNSTNNQIQLWTGFFNTTYKPQKGFQGYGYWESEQPLFNDELAVNSSLTVSNLQLTFQAADNTIRTVGVYQVPTEMWAATIDPTNGMKLQAQAGAGLGSAFISTGTNSTATNFWVQVNSSTVMDCIDRAGDFDCSVVPFI